MGTAAPQQTHGFGAALEAAVERMREASGADIVALYPYDEETDSFFAPLAGGLPESDLTRALPDLADQLRRYRADEAEGKTPEHLLPSHYGPSAWLLATRQSLVTADATRDVDISFVRRHKIRAMVALPLLAGHHVIGLLYLNYVDPSRQKIDVTDSSYLERIQGVAGEVALGLDDARHADEVDTLRSIQDLVRCFSSLPHESADEVAAASHLEEALQQVLQAAGLDAAALYVADTGGSVLTLAASRGCPKLAERAGTIGISSLDGMLEEPLIAESLAADGLHPLVSLTPSGQAIRAALLLADRNPIALQRRLPIEHLLLQTSADLLGGMVVRERLIEDLGETNRTLGAVTRLGARLLQPGASYEQVLRMAVAALTDPGLPELDFEFASVFLLDTTPEGELAVAQSAGATSSPTIDSIPDTSEGADGARRLPAWVTLGTRLLSPRDIVSYVANRRRAVVVEALDAHDDRFLVGYPEDRLERLQIRIVGREGTSAGQLRAVRLREAADRAPLRSAADQDATYRVTDEITLDADLFAAHGHGSLVRVFMPFGPIHTQGGTKRATGVLEAGYHISRRQRLERVQIEALRASATVLASAVETARLHEDVVLRARQLEIVTEVSRTIATSIDLEQTLSLVARNMARAVDASICLIALLEEDGSAWYGAAASDMEDVWRQRRLERPERSIVFEAADRNSPIVAEDALNHELISPYMARLLGIRSLVALPLVAMDTPIGAVILGQRDRQRLFTAEEVERAEALAGQAAMAIRNARVHAREEEEQHIQKDVILVGFGQWGRKAYQHLLLLKSFFNFRTHVVEYETPGRREMLAEAEATVVANGDAFYWDSPESPAHDALALELEPSCYVITYIATPAETHLPLLKSYYDLANVVLIEKPLGAPPDEYRDFLDRTDGSVQIVAADHYWFKIEVRLLELLLTEERNLRAFLDEIEEVEIEILEEQPPGGSGAQIGMIADLIPHAFAVLSLLTPLDRVKLADRQPLQVGMYHPVRSSHETYARLTGYFDHRGRQVRVTIDVGKGVANAKWIKLSGQRRLGGRRSFYKFDFAKGEAIDGTQSALNAAVRHIRQPGVPDNAHLSMLRHVIEKKHPAVGILSIREALRANARIQMLERMAAELMAAGQVTPYTQGQRPAFTGEEVVQLGVPRDMGAAAGTSGQ
ncbi:MAG: GAF domain-containing protein [Chloroflexi bacterium]|nr:GAF domain-containing protein [Chloroflexota bacterium]